MCILPRDEVADEPLALSGARRNYCRNNVYSRSAQSAMSRAFLARPCVPSLDCRQRKSQRKHRPEEGKDLSPSLRPMVTHRLPIIHPHSHPHPLRL
jgi:hypothetical protein